MVEPISIEVVFFVLSLGGLVWSLVGAWRSYLTHRDARDRAEHTAWQDAHVTLWDDARSQCEGASVTREW